MLHGPQTWSQPGDIAHAFPFREQNVGCLVYRQSLLRLAIDVITTLYEPLMKLVFVLVRVTS